MTKDDLLAWVKSQLTYRYMPWAAWPVVIERDGADRDNDEVFLVVRTGSTASDGTWAREGDELLSEDQRIPLGTRRDLIDWMRAHGVEIEATPEDGIRIMPTDPPFLITRYKVRDGERSVFDGVSEGPLLTEREHRLQSMPQRAGVLTDA